MEEEKRFYTTEDIARIFAVGLRQAQKIVGEIKKVNGHLALGKGKVLPRELAAWEKGVSA